MYIHEQEIQGVKMEVKTGTWTEKKGLAQMLKGGVIMDVVTPEHARIAEEAGACAVMALERVPAHERPRIDFKDHGWREYPRHGEMPHRTFCRGADS
jgi:hypothetical protein